jgi:hypothetical protein
MVGSGRIGHENRHGVTCAGHSHRRQQMTSTPDEPLGDEEMDTTAGGAAAVPGGDADGTDGGDGDSTDSTDGDSTDSTDGGDADGTDGGDGDSTDSTDGDSTDADGTDG